MNQASEIFSEIPMATWRWLGVNQALAPKGGTGERDTREILVESGKQENVTIVERESHEQEIHVDVKESAELSLTVLQLIPADSPHTLKIRAKAGKNAIIRFTAVEAGASETLSDIEISLLGEGSKADVAALYLGTQSRRIDMNYVINQGAKRTEAEMEVHGALLGESDKIFRGTLNFLEGAKGSVGRENEEVMLLSPNVRNRSVPLMLSHEDDVDGHHAVSIGKMDEEKLFYLMCRGMDLAEARQLVVEAAFHPILSRIREDELRREVNLFLKEGLSNGE